MIDLPALGWDLGFAEAFAPYAAAGLLPARVARAERGAADLLCSGGAVRARYAGDLLLDPPTTGNWTALRGWPDGPVTVEAVLPRRTALRRAVASGTSTEQPLAANVDTVVVVHALPAAPRLARIERPLRLASRGRGRP